MPLPVFAWVTAISALKDFAAYYIPNQLTGQLTVYERMKELREVGAGIALWANATHVMKNLGLLEEAVKVGYITTNYQFCSQQGKELYQFPKCLLAIAIKDKELLKPHR